MGKNSQIIWCHHTFNPWIGCAKVSEACANCYAEEMMDNRWKKVEWGAGKPRVKTSPGNWSKPKAWSRSAGQRGVRERVFCASLADVFDEEVDDRWRFELFELIHDCPYLDWLLLTKRPEKMRSFMARVAPLMTAPRGPIQNVWLGVSVENQERAEERIPILIDTPAAVRFLSCEPLLGPIDFNPLTCDMCGGHEVTWGDPGSQPWCNECDNEMGNSCWLDPDGIHWIIAGGESGKNARPSHPCWYRSLRDQCAENEVPFMFKQWGAWRPKLAKVAGDPAPIAKAGKWGVLTAAGDWSPETSPWNGRQMEDSHDDAEVVMVNVGKHEAGRTLDGRVWDGVPVPEAVAP